MSNVNAEFGSDFFLGISGNIIEPARARRIVQPVIATLRTKAHLTLNTTL